MNPAPISPGWALVAIALLWGLAGALDQPLDDGEPFEGPAIEQPAPAEPLLHLRCHREPEGPGTPQPGDRRGEPLIRLVFFRESQGDRHRPVRSLNDLDWFVKESEIITGNPGREFVVAGADQPTFRIHLDHVGYQIACVDRAEQAAAPVCATAPELVRHVVGDALARGQLFTTALQ
jgi:hypothetical protein